MIKMINIIYHAFCVNLQFKVKQQTLVCYCFNIISCFSAPCTCIGNGDYKFSLSERFIKEDMEDRQAEPRSDRRAGPG